MAIKTIFYITVRIDNEEASQIVKNIQSVTKGPAETVNAQIILNNFRQDTVIGDKTYLEWAGNIALQLAQGTLVDSYGNPSLANSDEVSGAMTEVEVRDADVDKNTN